MSEKTPNAVTLTASTTATAPTMDEAWAKLAGGTPGTPADPTSPVDSFPPDPTAAPSSPEDSSSYWMDGRVQGRPYLRDDAGMIYELRPSGVPAASATDIGSRLFINGQAPKSTETPYSPSQIIKRSGKVYVLIRTFWQLFQNGGMQNAALPAVKAPGGGAATGGVILPAAPPVPAIAPGSSGQTLEVAPGKYATIAAALAAAKDGDTVSLHPSTPREPFSFDKVLKISGNGVKWDFKGVPSTTLPYQKGAIVPRGPGWIIEGFDIAGVGMDRPAADLTCAIRPGDAPCRGVVRSCNLHHNQMGFGTGPGSIMVTLADTTFDANGLGDGRSHAIYVGAIHTLTAERITSTAVRSAPGSGGGHALKSRAANTTVVGGSYSAQDGSCIDAPNGGSLSISGATLTKPADSPDHKVISWAAENTNNGMSPSNPVTRCVFDLKCPSPLIFAVGPLQLGADCTWLGMKPVAPQGGGVVTGLPA